MELIGLIDRAAFLINAAAGSAEILHFGPALQRLVELRELLNEQPELEAGGANRDTDGEPERPSEAAMRKSAESDQGQTDDRTSNPDPDLERDQQAEQGKQEQKSEKVDNGSGLH